MPSLVLSSILPLHVFWLEMMWKRLLSNIKMFPSILGSSFRGRGFASLVLETLSFFFGASGTARGGSSFRVHSLQKLRSSHILHIFTLPVEKSRLVRATIGR